MLLLFLLGFHLILPPYVGVLCSKHSLSSNDLYSPKDFFVALYNQFSFFKMSLNFLRFTAIPIAVAFGHLHTHNELPTLKLLIKSAGKPTGNNPTITYEKFKTDSYKGIALFDGHGQHRMPN